MIRQMNDPLEQEEVAESAGDVADLVSPITLPTDQEDDIVAYFATYLGEKKRTIEGPTRKQHVVVARHIIAFILREYAGMSFPTIGRLLGNRDHTTIIHACNKMQSGIKNRQEFEKEYKELIEKAEAIKEQKRLIKLALNLETVLPRDSGLPPDFWKPKAREIPERNLKILDLYREGISLENIGKITGVTRERVRQVVLKTVQQIAVNESITRGVTMDAEVMFEEERKKRESAQGIGKLSTQVKEVKEYRWSRYYLACKSCGTTTIPHVRHGLCEQCVGNFRGARREKIIEEHGNKCDSCGTLRAQAIAKYGRDFYITKDKTVLCRGCFLKTTGKKLGGYKNFQWSRFHPECKSCGTTTIPHFKNGLCEKCADGVSPREKEELLASRPLCDRCGIGRVEAIKKYDRDLHVMQDRRVLCRKCFLINNRERGFGPKSG